MLNSVDVEEAYTVLQMETNLNAFGALGIFSTLDANVGYGQVNINDTDMRKMNFTLHFGLYIFLRILFSLENAASMFQHTMNIIVSTVKWQFPLVYPDDFVIFPRYVEKHLNRIRPVVRLLSSASVFSKLKKCFLFEDCVEYLVHHVQRWRFVKSKKATEAIPGLEHPTNVNELKYFLVSGTYFESLYRALNANLQCWTTSRKGLALPCWTTEQDWNLGARNTGTSIFIPRNTVPSNTRRDVIFLVITHVTSKLGLSYCRASSKVPNSLWSTRPVRYSRLSRHMTQIIGSF